MERRTSHGGNVTNALPPSYSIRRTAAFRFTSAPISDTRRISILGPRERLGHGVHLEVGEAEKGGRLLRDRKETVG